MDIKINSDVLCEGEKAGLVTCVIINPDWERITHIIVQEKDFPFTEKIVHLDKVLEADKDRAILNCTAKQLSEMEDFIRLEFAPIPTSALGYGTGEAILPYSSVIEVGTEHVPLGEFPVRQGAIVFAEGEEVGEIDDFLTDDKTKGKVSHIVLKEGHFWNLRNITIPVDEVEKVDDKGIYLKLTKAEVEKLPTVKAHNWFS